MERKNGIRRVKAHLELKLESDMKGSKKGFFGYISCKRKTRKNAGPQLNGARDLMAKDVEKCEVFLLN